MIARCGRSADDAELAARFAAAGDRWTFAGALTFGNAAEVLDDAEALAFPPSGVVDCAGVTVVDSAGVAVLLALKRRAQEGGVELRFVGTPASLRALADVYDVEELLGIG